MNIKDTFESRICLMFMHFSIILIIFRKKETNFPQSHYDDLFYCIENNLRELGFGDVAVNKKMKTLNKIFYDILLKINIEPNNFKINKKLVLKYFDSLNNSNMKKYKLFHDYFNNFYHFCFELSAENMIKDAHNFKI